MLTEDTTCYRHPEARAAVGCQRCGRPICPECMTQASIGHHCPVCLSGQNQQVYTPRNMPSAGITIVKALIALNVAIYIGQEATSDELTIRGWLFGPQVADGEWWRIITSAFLHGSLLHIGFNMYALWIIGNTIEDGIGKLRFALIYAAGLFGGSFAVLAFDYGSPTLGASGAVLGMAGGLAAILSSRGISLGQTSLGFILAINLALPLLVGGISFWGHLGGIAAGFAAGWLLSWLPVRLGQPQQVAIGATVALSVVLAAGSLVAASAGGFI